MHDIVGVGVFLMAYFAVVFFAPEMGGYFLEYNNFIPADPLVTPPHIAPVWYFTAFYSMLRATTDLMVNVLCVIIALAVVLAFVRCRCAMAFKVGMAVAGLVAIALLKTFDAKFWGVVVMGGAVLILFVLPWLDRSPARSIRYRPGWHKWVYAVFVVWFLILMVLGIMVPGPLHPSLPAWLTNEFVAMIGTLFYFAFFLLMPWWSQLGTPKPVPDRVTFKPH